MKKLMTNLNKQRGVTNIQIAVGLTVVALALLGGVGMLKYPTSMKAINETGELIDLRASTVNYATNHSGKFTGFTLATACALGFFPDGRCTGTGATTAVANTWGGGVSVAVVNVIGTDDGLKWTYSGLTSKSCIDQITSLWNSVAKIDVGSTNVKTSQNQALDDATTGSACKGANDNASIAWTMAAR